MEVVPGGWGVGSGETQYRKHMNSLPIGPRTSPPLTSLMLSRQTFRLKITTSLAESCGYELIISAEDNANPDGTLGKRAPSSSVLARQDY